MQQTHGALNVIVDMKKTTISDMEPDVIATGSFRRRVSRAIGTTDVALNHYRLAPGEGFPGGLHAHMDQEEVFVILDGQVTFETMDGETTVEEGEVIRFSPGEFQSGTNTANAESVALAIGAPRETTDIRIPFECPECDHENLRLVTDAPDICFTCPSCKSEQTPGECPHCGHAELRLTRNDGRTVTVCQECDSVFDSPPLRE